MSTLHCQSMSYCAMLCIPRTAGSIWPPQAEDNGEPHAAYKLTLFSRTRCPGPGACSDPLVFRSLVLPSDKPAIPSTTTTKPRFAPVWKACKCEMDMLAKVAEAKEYRAAKIAVVADTTTMKDITGAAHPAV